MANEPRRILEQPSLAQGGYTPSTIPKTSSYFALDVAGGKTHRMTPEEVVAFLNSEGLSVADADYTVSGIVERATQLEVDNGSGTGSTTAPLFVSPPELTTYVQNYVSTYVTNNAPQIVASAETTLNNAGDFFDFDTSALTPPVVGRKVIPVVLEKGTAGGELFAQNNLYNQEYTGATNLYSDGVDTPTDWVYFTPFFATRILRVNKNTAFSELVGSTTSGGFSNGKYGSGTYDPVFNRIYFFPSSGSYPNLLVLNLDDLTTREVSIPNSGYLNGVYSEVNGAIYVAPLQSPVTRILKIVPNNISETISDVGPSYGAVNLKFGDFVGLADRAYLIPRSIPQVYQFDYATETVTSLTTPTLAGQAYLRATLIGSNIYCAPWDEDEILKIDTLTNTVSKLGQTVPGTTEKYASPVFLPDIGKLYFIPKDAVGYLDFNLGTETFSVVGNATDQSPGIGFKNKIITGPLGSATRPADFVVSEPFFSPANPNPYFSVTNFFDTTGNVNRVAKSEDYDIDITEDGSGNITNIRVTMLTEGTKNVTLNLVYAGF